MASEKGSKDRKGYKRPVLARYFFLNDQLHRKVRINRGRDLLVTWNYPEGKKVTYSYSYVIDKHERAYTTAEVSEMVNRKRLTIEYAIRDGMIKRPQNTYGIDENRNFYQFMWREQDVIELHEYLATVHRGRPRKDGEITVTDLPTPRELRAMLKDSEVLYIKQGDEFVPVWRAKEF